MRASSGQDRKPLKSSARHVEKGNADAKGIRRPDESLRCSAVHEAPDMCGRAWSGRGTRRAVTLSALGLASYAL